MADPRVDLHGFDGFGRLAEEWRELLLACEPPLPFLAHSWLLAWQHRLGAAREFLCITVRREDRLVAALPLSIGERRFAGWRLRTVEIAGTGAVPSRGMGLADRADLLVRPGEEAARVALCEALAAQLDRADLIHLSAVPDSSPTLEALARAGLRPRVVERSRSPYLPLEDGWEAYLRSRSQRFRKQLKRSRRGLERLGPLHLERLEGSAAGDPAVIAEIEEVDRSSWKGRRGTGLFQHPAISAFAREAIPALANDGLLELHLLRVGDRLAAYEWAFDLGGTLFAYNAGYREDVAEHAPGNVVTAEVIRSACERGRREYDMMRGDEPYKLRWSALVRREVELFVPVPRMGARIATCAGPWAIARARRVRWVVELADRASGLALKLRRRGR